VDRRTIVRALLLGATIYALVLIAAAILPAIDGGLKSRALAYDFGRLRLQFSNAAFLIPAMAWVAVRLVIRPSIRDGAWLVLLAAAVVLSATRVSIIGGTGIVVLAAVTTAWRQPAPLSSHGRRLILGGVLLVASFGAAVTVLRIAQGDAGFLGRILFQDPGSSVGAIESGRFATYRAAIDVIDDSPIVGSGLGRLVQFDFSPGGSRPSTPGMQPGVDDAYLTVAMKAGVVGAIVFALMMLWPLWRAYHRRRDRLAWWFIPGWVGIIGLTVTQSFSTSGYGPFGVALLLVVLALRPIPESRTVPAFRAADVRPDR
jgi:O-antigen ligase